jgi:hypothetical protein
MNHAAYFDSRSNDAHNLYLMLRDELCECHQYGHLYGHLPMILHSIPIKTVMLRSGFSTCGRCSHRKSAASFVTMYSIQLNANATMLEVTRGTTMNLAVSVGPHSLSKYLKEGGTTIKETRSCKLKCQMRFSMPDANSHALRQCLSPQTQT